MLELSIASGHNTKGESNRHFNHANPTRGQRFFSLLELSTKDMFVPLDIMQKIQ